MGSCSWSNGLKVKGSNRKLKGDLSRRRRATGELYDDMVKESKKSGSPKPTVSREEFIDNKRNWRLPGVSKSIGKIHLYNETPKYDDNANPDDFSVNYRGGDRNWAKDAVYFNFAEHSKRATSRETTSSPSSYAGHGKWNVSDHSLTSTTRVLPKTSKGHVSVPMVGSKKGNDAAEDKAYKERQAIRKAKKAAKSQKQSHLGKKR